MPRCPRSKWTLLPHKMNYHNILGDAKGDDQPRFPGELPRHRPHRWENYSDDHVASKILTKHYWWMIWASWSLTSKMTSYSFTNAKTFFSMVGQTSLINKLNLIWASFTSGWSRYDHFASLCELLPVAVPRFSQLFPSINIILIVWDTIFMIVIVTVLMISSIFSFLKHHPVSA